MIRVLLFYRSLPAYRLDILRALSKSTAIRVVHLSGNAARGGIERLSETSLDRYAVLPTAEVGPLSIERGASEFLRAPGPDVLVLGPSISSSTVWLMAIYGRLRGMKVFLWGQCGRPGERGLKRYLKEVLNRIANGLLVYGASEADAACSLGLRKERVHIVGNAPSRLLTSSMETFSVSEVTGCDVVLTYVGRLRPTRELDMVLRSAANLRNENLSVGVIMAGLGSERERLEAIASELRVPVCFTGSVHSEEGLRRLYSQSTMAVSPGGIGLLAVQAISFGVPAVAPSDPALNGPEVEAIEPGVSGELFERGDQLSLDAAVRRVLARSSSRIDEENRARIVEYWSADATAARIEHAIVAAIR